jgi:hypothetical protein
MTDESLHTVSTEFTVPDEEFERQVKVYLEQGKKHSAFAHLQMFALYGGLWPEWSAVATETAEINRQTPFLALAGKMTVTPDGRPLERPVDPEKRREFDEIGHYILTVRLSLQFAARKLAIFRAHQAWNEDLLRQALAHGMLFDTQVLECVMPGIRAFEEGRYWEALHILVPQIERAVRRLAQGLGAAYRYVSSTGEIQWSSLESLLDEPRVAEALAKLSSDVARELKCLLVDQRGMNLRNDVCHGILQHDVDAGGLSFLCVLILLTLSMLALASSPLDAPRDDARTDKSAADDEGPKPR